MDRVTQLCFSRLAEHGDDLQAVLSDDELNRALDAFRGDRPRQLRCGQPGCKGKLMWVAISPYEPRVLGSPLGPLSDELAAKRRRDHDLPPSSTEAGLPTLYAHWSLVATGGFEFGETPPEDEPLHPHKRLRRLLTCPRPRCQARYLVTNSELLCLLVGIQDGEIVLPQAFRI